jgi:hypothetical protein
MGKKENQMRRGCEIEEWEAAAPNPQAGLSAL